MYSRTRSRGAPRPAVFIRLGKDECHVNLLRSSVASTRSSEFSRPTSFQIYFFVCPASGGYLSTTRTGRARAVRCPWLRVRPADVKAAGSSSPRFIAHIGEAWTSVECVLPAAFSASKARGFGSTRTPPPEAPLHDDRVGLRDASGDLEKCPASVRPVSGPAKVVDREAVLAVRS